MFATPAYAQAAGAAAQGGSSGMFLFVGQLLLLGVLFYFLMVRPQQKRMKDLRTSIEGAKKGDTVVTAGGLIGKVSKVSDDEVEIDLNATVKGIRVVKATIASVTPAGSGKPAND